MPRPLPAGARLVPLDAPLFATVAALAEAIWRQHYTPIIGAAQVEYMLAGRYTPGKLRLYLGAADRWFEVLELDGRAVGYCSYALVGGGEMKLEQLYLLHELRGRGFGGAMLARVEEQARARGCTSLMLTVNRHNTGSIALYEKSGFAVREEAKFDIGSGYVMDDYVMAKAL